MLQLINNFILMVSLVIEAFMIYRYAKFRIEDTHTKHSIYRVKSDKRFKDVELITDIAMAISTLALGLSIVVIFVSHFKMSPGSNYIIFLPLIMTYMSYMKSYGIRITQGKVFVKGQIIASSQIEEFEVLSQKTASKEPVIIKLSNGKNLKLSLPVDQLDRVEEALHHITYDL